MSVEDGFKTIYSKTNNEPISPKRSSYQTNVVDTIEVCADDYYPKQIPIDTYICSINVSLIDTIAPVIRIIGYNPQIIPQGKPYRECGATAHDELGDGVIDSSIIIIDSVNTDIIGNYNVHYFVSDKAGNETHEIRIVNVIDGLDTIPPMIILNGPPTMNIQVGYNYTEPGAKAYDNVDGIISHLITIDASEVNVNIVGVYSVYYNVIDSAGLEAKDTRIVDIYDP